MSDDEIIQRMQDEMQGKWEMHPEAKELQEMKSNNMLKIGG